MSLRLNIIANYVSQIYVAFVGIVVLPLFIKCMGAEAYGLVGFFFMLQVLFNLLDMGFTPAVARETARFNGGSMSELNYRRLVRTLERIFVGVGVLAGGGVFAASNWIAQDWLNVTQLAIDEVALVVKLIAVIVTLRWICGLYRGVISGSERLVWLSVFNAGIATLRFVLILPVLFFVSSTPRSFFYFQLMVAVVELVGLAMFSYKVMPRLSSDEHIKWEWAPLKPVLKFSISLAFTSLAWVMVTQTDKLILSKILSLSDYGYFTVAVLLSSGIYIMSSPISGAIMPLMSRLQVQGQHSSLIEVYRQATQLMMVIGCPITLVLVFYSEQVLWAWTGDSALVEKVAPVLRLYAAGYGILAASAFPYYLQYAKGDLKLHLIGSVLFLLLLIPSVILGTIYYGMVGAGWVWLGANLIYFLIWTPLVHRHLKLELHFSWICNDILRPCLPAILLAMVSLQFNCWSTIRWVLTIELIISGCIFIIFTYSQANRLKIHL